MSKFINLKTKRSCVFLSNLYAVCKNVKRETEIYDQYFTRFPGLTVATPYVLCMYKKKETKHKSLHVFFAFSQRRGKDIRYGERN